MWLRPVYAIPAPRWGHLLPQECTQEVPHLIVRSGVGERAKPEPCSSCPAPACLCPAPACLRSAPACLCPAPACLCSAPARLCSAPARLCSAPARLCSAPACLCPAPACLRSAPACLCSARITIRALSKQASPHPACIGTPCRRPPPLPGGSGVSKRAKPEPCSSCWAPACLMLGTCLPLLGTCLPLLGTCLPLLGTCLPPLGTCLPLLGTCLPLLSADNNPRPLGTSEPSPCLDRHSLPSPTAASWRIWRQGHGGHNHQIRCIDTRVETCYNVHLNTAPLQSPGKTTLYPSHRIRSRPVSTHQPS